MTLQTGFTVLFCLWTDFCWILVSTRRFCFIEHFISVLFLDHPAFVTFFHLFSIQFLKNRSHQTFKLRKKGFWNYGYIPNNLMTANFLISIKFSYDLPVLVSITGKSKFFMFQAKERKMVLKMKNRLTLRC